MKASQTPPKKPLTIKDYFGEDIREKLIQRIDNFLASENGFLIMVDDQTGDNHPRVTDLYKGMCLQCVLDAVLHTVKDADKHGLLPMPHKNHGSDYGRH